MAPPGVLVAMTMPLIKEEEEDCSSYITGSLTVKVSNVKAGGTADDGMVLVVSFPSCASPNVGENILFLRAFSTSHQCFFPQSHVANP